MITINLLPGAEQRARGSSFSVAAAFSNVGDQFADKYTMGGSTAILLSMLAIAGMYFYQTHHEQQLNDRETVAAGDSARFSTVLIARRRAETTRDSVYQQLAIIKSIDDSRYTWPHVLEEINMALPPYTWLTSIEQTSAVTTAAGASNDTSAAKGKPDSTKSKVADNAEALAKQRRAHADSLYLGNATGMTFRIIGQTVDIQALTRFMKSLEASPYIKNVQLTRSDLVTTGSSSQSQPVTEFQLEAQTAVPPAAMLRTVPLSITVH